MPSGNLRVFPAASATERGLPPIEFLFRPAAELLVNELTASSVTTECGVVAVMTCVEKGSTGRTVGRIAIGLFRAALIVDRAGSLRELADTVAKAALARPDCRLLGQGEVEFAGGANGYRIDTVLLADESGRFRPELPYASWLALAGHDPVVPGGVFMLVRSAAPDWPAGAQLLDSLEIGGARAGSARDTVGLGLPLVRHR